MIETQNYQKLPISTNSVDESVIEKAKHGIISVCLICKGTKLQDGKYHRLDEMPIAKVFIEAFYTQSHGLCDPCVPEYIKRYGG